MDRHVEFVSQLSRLVSLYARDAEDRTAEKAALRAARAAAKHGAVSLAIEDSVLRAGAHAVQVDEVAELPALRAALVTAGVARIQVAHHAKQADFKVLGQLLARVVRGELAGATFRAALDEQAWEDTRVELAEAGLDAAAPATDPAEPPAGEPAAPQLVPVDEAAPKGESPAVEEATSAVVEDATVLATEPLAIQLPPAAAALASEPHRHLFERLISSTEPGTLRLFIEPVQAAVEQALREGRAADALQLLLALLDCEELAIDQEMRRQFVVALRRLTKPVLLRGLAMLYTDEPSLAPGVERVMRRFGEDGAEAVIDRIACAPNAAWRAQYTELLGRLPAARDALVEMVDDDRPAVVERAVDLCVRLKFSDAERVLGDQLSHPAPRVRRAAVRGLAEYADSVFAIDALLRALQDDVVDVRLAAAVALQSRRDPRLVVLLVQRLEEDADLDVQLALIVALGRLGALEGVQKLVALAASDPRVQRKRDGVTLRLAAIEALGEARTSQAMVTLQKLLEDRDKDVREMAARLYTRARRQTVAGTVAAGVTTSDGGEP